ncbi:hypothetical protein HBP99_05760 [Listeria booriae]|uniref:hypothetical protein n=1 Tax=Listeria booriae TaxID=1552123 RepID=UPI00162763AE|nr:hypothetical protein [Listeria booriae]MBC2368131.1 hypothetical protein [Listeria booriae]
MSLLQIDEKEAKKLYKETVRELLEEEGLIGSIWKMDRMLLECVGYGERWVVDHICNHPYVIKHQIAVKFGGEWTFKAKRIVEFIDMYYPELGVNHKRGVAK